MRNRVFKRKLNVKTSHGDLLMRSMLLSLLQGGKMKTVSAKAKVMKSYADEQISYAVRIDKAEREDKVASRLGSKRIGQLLAKYAGFLSDKMPEVKGGFVKIMKVGYRAGDNSEMSEITLIGRDEFYKKPKAVAKAKKTKKPVAKKVAEKVEKKVEKKEPAAHAPEEKKESFLARLGGRLLGRKQVQPVYTGKKQRSNARSGL